MLIWYIQLVAAVKLACKNKRRFLRLLNCCPDKVLSPIRQIVGRVHYFMADVSEIMFELRGSFQGKSRCEVISLAAASLGVDVLYKFLFRFMLQIELKWAFNTYNHDKF